LTRADELPDSGRYERDALVRPLAEEEERSLAGPPKRVCCWRYTENEKSFPGWNLAADPAACVELVAQLEELLRATEPSSVTRALEAPTPDVLAVPNNLGGGAALVAVQELRVAFVPSSPPDRWRLEPSARCLGVSAGSAALRELIEQLEDVRDGDGDCWMGSGEDELWFWWTPRVRVSRG